MTRDEWKQRLKDAGIDDDLVEEFVGSLKDDDLVRMKEFSSDELKTVLTEALKETCSTDEEEEEPVKTKSSDEEMEDADEEAEDADDEEKPPATSMKDLLDFADYIVAKVKDQIGSQEIEIEVPALSEIKAEFVALKDQIAAMTEEYKSMVGMFKDLVKDDAERLKDTVASMSEASRARLQRHFTVDSLAAVERATALKEAKTQSTPSSQSGAVIKDADGNVYASLTDFAAGVPVNGGD